jgi:hypothetical protein
MAVTAAGTRATRWNAAHTSAAPSAPYARRERSHSDRRRYLVRLTDQGAGSASEVLRRLRHAQDDLLAPLSVEERGLLRQLLARMITPDTAPCVAPQPATDVDLPGTTAGHPARVSGTGRAGRR